MDLLKRVISLTIRTSSFSSIRFFKKISEVLFKTFFVFFFMAFPFKPDASIDYGVYRIISLIPFMKSSHYYFIGRSPYVKHISDNYMLVKEDIVP